MLRVRARSLCGVVVAAAALTGSMLAGPAQAQEPALDDCGSTGQVLALEVEGRIPGSRAQFKKGQSYRIAVDFVPSSSVLLADESLRTSVLGLPVTFKENLSVGGYTQGEQRTMEFDLAVTDAYPTMQGDMTVQSVGALGHTLIEKQVCVRFPFAITN
ncbi:hypothetical protein [Streptomyces sp. NPDC023588]|uniref:hypothetical protein n=1 Tax=Streptomyces sp. NPDC023588 TaxID=3154907 RepID=UPI003400CF0A